MAEARYTTNALNRCRVSPPVGSVPATHLPLAFFDLIWVICVPIRRFFFYDFPHSTEHFINSIFPTLKHSLSLTLQRFFPLAGNFILPPPPHKPHLLYTGDGDSVSLTVAESSDCDFPHLIADYPRDAKDFYPFVPDSSESSVLPDGTLVVPLMALQITVFPNQGLCICMEFQHVVADGMAVHHFLKSWASVCRNICGLDSVDESPLPYLDRATVKDPNDFESALLEELWSCASFWFPIFNKPIKDLAPVNKVRATFVLSRNQLERLKILVSTQATNSKELEPFRVSAFIVTCSLIWACLIKSKEISEENNVSGDKDEFCYLVLLADCRNRLRDSIPSAYFGNCLDMCVVMLKKSEVLKHNNIVGVAKAIGNRVEEFEREPLKMVDKWFSDWRRFLESGEYITIAGSPKFGVYDTDFGWGRPKKSEVLHVDTSKLFSVQECRDEKGGIEVGLGLSRTHMDCFMSIWEENLKVFCS